jgi:hypothetical protein
MKASVAIVFAAILALFAQSAVAQPKTPEIKSEPAWCGGSWWPGAVDEKGVQVEPAGTSLGECKPMARKDGDKDVMVPTHPAYPASQVVFQQDKDGRWVPGMNMTEMDKDNKPVTVFKKIEPIVRPGPAK